MAEALSSRRPPGGQAAEFGRETPCECRRRLNHPASESYGVTLRFDSAPKYTPLMAMEYVVQRLEMGDVVLIDLPEQGGEVEAKVVEPIDRTKTTVRVSLRVAGREDFVKEWPLGEKVTVVRGP